MLDKKGVRIQRSDEAVVGGGFERAGHVTSERTEGHGMDELVKGWLASQMRTDAGNVGW